MSGIPNVLAVGVAAVAVELLKQTMGDVKYYNVQTYEELEDVLDHRGKVDYGLIICGDGMMGLPAIELAQALRAEFAKAFMVALIVERKNFDLPVLKKNGFNEAYLFQTEADLFKETVGGAVAEKKRLEYISVSLDDIPTGMPVGADLHLSLPVNQKEVRLLVKTDSIDEKTKLHLKDHNYRSLQIRKEDLSDFFKAMTKAHRVPGESNTVKHVAIQSSARLCFSSLWFDPGNASGLAEGHERLEKIHTLLWSLKQTYTELNPFIHMFERMNGKTAAHEHGLATALIASLFSIGTGIGKPEEMAMAGLLHDIGEVALPPELLQKPRSEWTAEEWIIYQGHPVLTIQLLKERKIDLNPSVISAILKHHQRVDGKGYPAGYTATREALEAQIVGLADLFDEMIVTRAISGFHELKTFYRLPEIEGKFDAGILQKIRALIPGMERAARDTSLHKIA